MKTYKQLNAALSGRNSQRRKLANHTYAERQGESIAIKLHQTDVVTFHNDGRIVLNSGGFRTSTTKARINSFAPVRLWQHKGEWTFTTEGSPRSHLFADGCVVYPNGTVGHCAKPSETQERQAKRKAILKFAKLCADSVPLPHPGAGDCFYCMKTTEGDTLGEATRNCSHLESHMEEGYVVPSLVYRALEFAGYDPQKQIIHSLAFSEAGNMQNVGRDAVKRSVRKYMLRQFGMAA